MHTSLFLPSILGLLSFITPSLATSTTINSSYPCPLWRNDALPSYGVDDFTFDEGDSRWPLPPSTCLAANTRTFRRDNMAFTLHQPEDQHHANDSRRGEVLYEIDAAVGAGLDLFGDHAGTPSRPLEIHATLFDAELTDQWVIDHIAKTDRSPGQATSPCSLIIRFPHISPDSWHTNQSESNWTWLTRMDNTFKKEVVDRMYRCVIQYHRLG
ncbi:hypothetical protein OQA88_735 [Cercophora sp. LCS_1]